MHIKNSYCDAIPNDNHSTKAKDDVFIPTTKPSKIYKIWHALLDLKTCFECVDKHGRIFLINDTSFKEPPLHIGCRCTIEETEAVEAGSATLNGTEGADYWLKYYGELPEYYISSAQLEALGWKKMTSLQNLHQAKCWVEISTKTTTENFPSSRGEFGTKQI